MTEIDANELAQEMGITPLKRYSETDSAKILKISPSVLVNLRAQRKVDYLKLPSGGVEYFGKSLVEYIMSTLQPAIRFTSRPEDRTAIMRFCDVKAVTGLSRSTIWRYEQEGIFPNRVSLGGGSIGWYRNEVEQWIASRKRNCPV